MLSGGTARSAIPSGYPDSFGDSSLWRIVASPNFFLIALAALFVVHVGVRLITSPIAAIDESWATSIRAPGFQRRAGAAFEVQRCRFHGELRGRGNVRSALPLIAAYPTSTRCDGRVRGGGTAALHLGRAER